MPKLSEFSNSILGYAIEIVKTSEKVVDDSARFGAKYMRDYIREGSPTGSKWHDMKNEINGYAYGARIGGTISGSQDGASFLASDRPRRMLGAVASTIYKVEGGKISANYGWIKDQQKYFLLQDTGGYIKKARGRGKTGMGMGLLNSAADGGGKDTLQKLGAYYATNDYFVKRMKTEGFKASGSISQ